ncbi:MAG: hypothetical protein QW584_04320 [Thermofilaceae archaeon]
MVILAMLAVALQVWRNRVSTRARRETRVVEGVASEEVETRVAVELERLRVLEDELEEVKGYLSKLEEEWKKKGRSPPTLTKFSRRSTRIR